MPSFPVIVSPMPFGAPSIAEFLWTPIWTPTLFWVVVAELLWLTVCCLLLWSLGASGESGEPVTPPPKKRRAVDPDPGIPLPSAVRHAPS
jgi:hypothetical protein